MFNHQGSLAQRTNQMIFHFVSKFLQGKFTSTAYALVNYRILTLFYLANTMFMKQFVIVSGTKIQPIQNPSCKFTASNIDGVVLRKEIAM